jgi:hypothetical protein
MCSSDLTCEGLGFQRGANVDLLIGDKALSLRQGVVTAWPSVSGEWLPFAEAIAKHGGFTLDTPWQKLTPSQQRVVLQGTGEAWLGASSEVGSGKAEKAKSKSGRLPTSDFKLPTFQYKGLFPAIDEASRVSFMYRWRLEHLLDEVPCVACKGARLRPDSAATRFQDRTIGELTGLHDGQHLVQENERRFAFLQLRLQPEQLGFAEASVVSGEKNGAFRIVGFPTVNIEKDKFPAAEIERGIRFDAQLVAKEPVCIRPRYVAEFIIVVAETHVPGHAEAIHDVFGKIRRGR